MDGLVFDLTGVILQVLCLLAALCNLGVEAAALVLQVQSKDKPRSPQGDEPGPKEIRTAEASPRAVGSNQLPAARLHYTRHAP